MGSSGNSGSFAIGLSSSSSTTRLAPFLNLGLPHCGSIIGGRLGFGGGVLVRKRAGSYCFNSAIVYICTFIMLFLVFITSLNARSDCAEAQPDDFMLGLPLSSTVILSSVMSKTCFRQAGEWASHHCKRVKGFINHSFFFAAISWHKSDLKTSCVFDGNTSESILTRV